MASKKNIDVNEMVFQSIVTIVDKQPNVSSWTGSMTNLMSALNRVLNKQQRSLLPGSPSALRLVVNRVTNRLRNRGIGVRFGRTTDHGRTRFVKFTQ